MKKSLLNLSYLRRKERNSMFYIIALLLFSSFLDEGYFFIKKRYGGSTDRAISTAASMPSELTPKAEPDLFSASKTDTALRQQKTIAPKKEKQELITNTDSVQQKEIKPIKTVYSKVGTLRKLTPEKKKTTPLLETHDEAAADIAENKTLKDIRIDPNQPIFEDLIKLGVSKYAAQNWVKYTAAGGRMRTIEDLSKIYQLEQETIDRIENNLDFKNISEEAKKKPQSTTAPDIQKKKEITVLLNQAEAIDFARISGIGPVLSERILKFREKLGGFHSFEQLKEVYGIDPEVIEQNRDKFRIEKQYAKININTCSEEELARHSYCSFKLAKVIIQYRKQHGPFQEAIDLKEIRIINEDWINKISPYLTY